MDGVGKTYEYVRYPANYNVVYAKANVRWRCALMGGLPYNTPEREPEILKTRFWDNLGDFNVNLFLIEGFLKDMFGT